MLESRPPHSPGRAVGLALIVGLTLLDAILVVSLLSMPISLLSFLLGLLVGLSVPVIILVAFSTASLSRARYYARDNFLIIEWGRLRQVVRLQEIRTLYSSQDLRSVSRFRGIRWPGNMLGWGQVIDKNEQGIKTRFYATRPLAQQLLVSTDTIAYGLSPKDPSAFQSILEDLLTGDYGEDEPEIISDLGFLSWDIWRDRLAQICLALALFLNGLLFAFLTGVMGRLPSEIALHFDEFGQGDRFGSPTGLFVLPVIGLIAWVVSGLLGWFFYEVRREKPVAYIVWSTTVVIELATWVAIIGLMPNGQ